MKREHAWIRAVPTLLHGRIGRRTRRAVAAALLLAAVAVAVTDAATAEPTGVPTVVAARDIPSGETVAVDDLRVARFPDRLRPADAVSSPSEVAGHGLSGAVSERDPITTARLLSHETRRSDRDTVPIRLADAGVAGLLEPGTSVDVVTLGDDATKGRELASKVTVLTVTDDQSVTDTKPAGDEEGPLVLLAVPTDTATGLAATALQQPVTVTLS